MSPQKQKRYYLIFFLLGAATSPLMISLYSGLVASFHPSVTGYHEPTEGEEDSARLLASYRNIESPIPQWGRWNYPPASCGYTDAQTNKLLVDTADYRSLPALQYHLARMSGFYIYRSLRPLRESDTLMSQTTPFERGFLSACLNSIVLRPFCRQRVALSIRRMEQARAAEEASLKGKLDRAAANVECLYLDGLNAREKKAAFLPPR